MGLQFQILGRGLSMFGIVSWDSPDIWNFAHTMVQNVVQNPIGNRLLSTKALPSVGKCTERHVHTMHLDGTFVACFRGGRKSI